MPTQLKRPASARAAVSKEKKRPAPPVEAKAKAPKQQEDPLAAKRSAVIGLLSTAEGLSEATLRILKVAVESCLAAPKESRHEVQHTAVEMIGEVLRDIEAGHAAKVDALRSKIAEAEVDQAKREASVEVATATAKAKSDVLVAAGTALEEAKGVTAAAKKARVAAAAEQKAGDTSLVLAGGRKTLAEQVLGEDFTPLKDGTAADVSKSLKNVAKAGKELAFEAQLLQSAELVLGKAPADRGKFDVMVADQIHENFGSAIARLADELDTGEAGKAARARKVEECDVQVEAAVANADACGAQLEAARAALKEAEMARMAAQKSVVDFDPEMAQAATNLQAANIALYACKADLDTFAELVEGPQAAPAVAPVEAAGEAVDVVDADTVEAPDVAAA